MYRFVDKNERCDFRFNDINDYGKIISQICRSEKRSERLIFGTFFIHNLKGNTHTYVSLQQNPIKKYLIDVPYKKYQF